MADALVTPGAASGLIAWLGSESFIMAMVVALPAMGMGLSYESMMAEEMM